MVEVNGFPIGNDCYPNNERIFKEFPKESIQHSNFISVDFKYESDLDISKLIFLKKYLDDEYPNYIIFLNMFYVPYSRMDRKIEGYMFSLKYFCYMINSLHFDKVFVLDVHSSVTTDLLNNAFEIGIQYEIKDVLENNKIDYVLYPDKGAFNRYSKTLNLSIPCFYANKKRNLNTGEIISFELVDCPDIKDKNILIIEDVITTGSSINRCAELLIKNGAKKVIILAITRVEGELKI
jgi:ribose-phosphate pyrophosphokinase